MDGLRRDAGRSINTIAIISSIILSSPPLCFYSLFPRDRAIDVDTRREIETDAQRNLPPFSPASDLRIICGLYDAEIHQRAGYPSYTRGCN